MKKLDRKITKSGLAGLKQQKENFKMKLQKVDQQLRDLSLSQSTYEDVEYQQLRYERIDLINEIKRIDSIVKTAEVISSKKYTEARRGCKIHLVNHKICYKFQLVDSVEANPNAGKISCESPMGKALYHKRVGDEVTVPTPLGEIKFNIAAIQ